MDIIKQEWAKLSMLPELLKSNSRNFGKVSAYTFEGGAFLISVDIRKSPIEIERGSGNQVIFFMPLNKIVLGHLRVKATAVYDAEMLDPNKTIDDYTIDDARVELTDKWKAKMDKGSSNKLMLLKLDYDKQKIYNYMKNSSKNVAFVQDLYSMLTFNSIHNYLSNYLDDKYSYYLSDMIWVKVGKFLLMG
jgi:hypothetical protein